MKSLLADQPAVIATKKDRFDPIELEILWKRLISVVDEASAAFVRTCFSTLVRDGNDFAIVLTDAKGRSLAQSTMSLPGFIGCLPATVRHFLDKYPGNTMRPGDVFITNDPWKGSGHIHDVTSAMDLSWLLQLWSRICPTSAANCAATAAAKFTRKAFRFQ